MDFFLIAWIQSLYNLLWSFILFIANLLWTIIVYVYNGLVWVALNAWRGLNALGRLFVRLWRNILRPALLRVWKGLLWLRRWLIRIFGPLICYLIFLRDLLDDIFDTYIRPVLDMIQRVRRVLAAFRLLGFRWAERLDARLQRIETAISEAFLFIRGYLVAIIDVLEQLVDPLDLLLHAPVFGGSLGKWLGFLSALLGGVGIGAGENLEGLMGPQRAARDLSAAMDGDRNWLSGVGGFASLTLIGLRRGQ